MTDHRLFGLVSDFLTDGWRADCSCGWEGSNQPTTSLANAEFERHRDAAQVDAVRTNRSSHHNAQEGTP